VLRVGRNKRALRRALISAAGWVPFAALEKFLPAWIDSNHPGLRILGLRAYGVHRRNPGPALLHRLHDEHPAVRGRALKTAGELGRLDLLPSVRHALADTDRRCRFFAAWSAVLLGDRMPETLAVLRQLADSRGRYQERALTLAVRCLDLLDAHTWLRQLWKNPKRLRSAAIAAGALGDPALAGVLIEMMALEPVAKVAGEAFTMITGADLKYLDLNKDAPEHPQDDETYWATVHEKLGEDDDLPFPNAELVAKWWQTNQDRFAPGRRYLCGQPIAADSLHEVLRRGKQRQRVAAALELDLMEPGRPLFDVRARGDWQERELGV
jgi:uncharacterized protein (TIGR02270 family)